MSGNRSETELMKAARYEEVDLVRSLLENGADVNALDENGKTALIHAVDKNWLQPEEEASLAVVDLLIQAGADLNQQDELNGCAALHYAAALNLAGFVGQLLRAGADPNLRLGDGNRYQFRSGETALMLAARHNGPAAVTVLLAAGADVNLQDEFSRQSALAKSAEEGHADITAILIAAGARPNQVDTYGATPLMKAVAEDHPDTVRVLLEAGADVSVIHPISSRSVLDTAYLVKNQDIIALLESAGARKNLP